MSEIGGGDDCLLLPLVLDENGLGGENHVPVQRLVASRGHPKLAGKRPELGSPAHDRRRDQNEGQLHCQTFEIDERLRHPTAQELSTQFVVDDLRNDDKMGRTQGMLKPTIGFVRAGRRR